MYKIMSVLMVAVLIQSKGFAQRGDTVTIKASDLSFHSPPAGTSSFLVYNKKAKEAPPEKMVLVRMDVAEENVAGVPSIVINQQWYGSDTVVHSALTMLRQDNFSTIYHRTYWKRLGYTSEFDFRDKKISFTGNVPDSSKSKMEKDFLGSFGSYNLNWHSDLFVFSLLPYRLNRTFRIRFYDPGFGEATDVFYTVTREDTLVATSGEKVACWVMETPLPKFNGYQRFWISKEQNEVLEEEDLFAGQYRYKLRILANEY